MPRILITGANRGLGLEFARQYAEEGWRVFATCRHPEGAEALNQLSGRHPELISLHRLDVVDHASISLLAQELREPIDLLLNNAGVYGDRRGFGGVDYEEWARTLRVNTMAPLKVTEEFVEHVARSELKLVAHVTSKMGSIEDNTSGGSYVYRSSKAALNMVNKSLAVDLRPRGIACCVLHPGWVATDMGGASAPLQVPESVRGMRAALAGFTLERSGAFLDYDGRELPW